MTLYGWDLSNHDWDRHPVSLANAKKSGISLVTHKATEGNWYRDPDFPKFTAQLAHTAFPVEGSYHVLNHGINVQRQTDYWIEYVADHIAWQRRACWIWQIDAEPLDGYAAPTKAEIVACGQRVQKRLGVLASQIIVYGPRWVYGDSLRGIPYRLWASNYVTGGRAFKSVYPGDGSSGWDVYSGQTPLILQYTSTATIGDQHTCDANAIRVNSAAALQALFKPHPKPQPPAPTGEDPEMIIVVVDEKTVPKGKAWPGYFTFDGQHLAYIHAAEGKRSNLGDLEKKLGAPVEIGYQQYLEWGGK